MVNVSGISRITISFSFKLSPTDVVVVFVVVVVLSLSGTAGNRLSVIPSFFTWSILSYGYPAGVFYMSRPLFSLSGSLVVLLFGFRTAPGPGPGPGLGPA